jgi:hypothetical protein
LQIESLILFGLGVSDLILVASAAVGLVLSHRLRPAKVVDIRAAFEVLDRSIERYLPGLPRGYTWGEAFQLLKSRHIDADWTIVEQTLSEYEAHRYGGRPAPTRGQQEIISLALKLGGGVKWKES